MIIIHNSVAVCSRCVCCPLLLLLLWPQLAAGFVLRSTDMLRSTDNLLEALYEAQEEMNKLTDTDTQRHLLPYNCSRGVASLDQAVNVLQNLSSSCCLQKMQATVPHFSQIQSDLIYKSQEVLRHVSSKDPVSCSSTLYQPLNYNDVTRLVECVSCWIQQVELVKSALKPSIAA